MPNTIRRDLLDKALEDVQFPNAIIDLGGKRSQKRGNFRYPPKHEVIYVNIDPDSSPDILCDVSSLPFEAGTQGSAVMCEVLEHLPEPYDALSEVARVLETDGLFVLSVPFLVGIHADPSDFQRFTPFKLQQFLEKAGFYKIEIYQMGGIWCVIHDLVHQHLVRNTSFLAKIGYRILNIIKLILPASILKIDDENHWKATTGYFLICRKK
jgi:SAM-dependent methyltransferase